MLMERVAQSEHKACGERESHRHIEHNLPRPFRVLSNENRPPTEYMQGSGF